MSGKPKQTGWGGARPGAGRPFLNRFSDQQTLKLHREIRKREKIEGRRWQSILMDLVYGCEIRDGERVDIEMSNRDRITAIKLLADLSLIKTSEQSITVTRTDGPTIYLPEVRKDNLVPITGGKVAGDK